jgi:sterol 3beta-glucosyltransferase
MHLTRFRGWGGLGTEEVPSNIFMLGNCPHDWLFKQVSAVVHHGGAGTTAIGLRLGRPTVIVPFFGDQAFWARMVCAAGAGPEPQPFKTLTAEKLAKAITFALSPEATLAAADLAKRMADEDGATTAAMSFHRLLPLKDMRCSLFPQKLAVWQVKKTNILLSSFASIVLVENKWLKSKDLKPYLEPFYALLILDAHIGPLT